MRRTLLLLFTVAMAGCGDDVDYEISEEDATRYAELRCGATTACCEETATDCVERRRDALLELQGRSPGPLTFSRECMQEALASIESLGCETERELEIPACELARGQRRLGESCFTFGDIGFYASDCGDGLQCAGGVCLDDPLQLVEAPPGGSCNIQQGWICEQDYFCSEEQRCEVSVVLGEPCTTALQCRSQAVNYCAGLSGGGSGQCTIRPVLGEPCSEPDACGFHRTESGGAALICEDGTCSLPLLGPAACSESLE